MSNDTKAFIFACSIVAVMGVVLLLPVVDMAFSKKVRIGSGVVVDKFYRAADSSTGIGSAPNGDAVLVSNSTPEEWGVIVKCKGETFSLSIDANAWGNIEHGQVVDVYRHHGLIGKYRRRIETSVK